MNTLIYKYIKIYIQIYKNIYIFICTHIIIYKIYPGQGGFDSPSLYNHTYTHTYIHTYIYTYNTYRMNTLI
jgi:hypothetical protein